MNAPTDDNFRDAYAVYGRNYDKRLQAMLAALPRVPRNVRRVRLLPAVAAVALVVGLGVAAFLSFRTVPAYGLDGLRERLQTLHSLYIKGSLYKRTKTAFGMATIQVPIERYYERPSRYYNTYYGFSSGFDGLTQVTRSSTANDGQRALTLLPNENKAILSSTVDPLDTELYVENALQVSEIEQLVGTHPQDFERVGSERLNGHLCDIYQSKSIGDGDFSWRVWVNPSDGLPARVTGITRDSKGNEELLYEYTEIRANIDPPSNLFSFQVPDGYKVSQVSELAKSKHIVPSQSGGTGNHSAGEWVALRIDDRAVLLCWSEWIQNEQEKIWFRDKPQLVLEGAANRECLEHSLYETMSGDLRWKWSLILPKDKKALGTDSLAIKFSNPKGGSVSIGVQPLIFPEHRLAELVEKVQRRSLEAGSDFSAVKSIGQLRQIIANVPKGSE